jgi:hypothetical protein
MATAEDHPMADDKAIAPASVNLEEAPIDDDAPPNGGLVAWLQVTGCFALYLNTL